MDENAAILEEMLVELSALARDAGELWERIEELRRRVGELHDARVDERSEAPARSTGTPRIGHPSAYADMGRGHALADFVVPGHISDWIREQRRSGTFDGERAPPGFSHHVQELTYHALDHAAAPLDRTAIWELARRIGFPLPSRRPERKISKILSSSGRFQNIRGRGYVLRRRETSDPTRPL